MPIKLFYPIMVFIVLIFEEAAMNDGTIKIVFSCSYESITPLFYGYQANTTIGALAYTLDMITSGNTLLAQYNFELRYVDSNCNSKDALGGIIALLETNYTMQLAVGPLCSSGLSSMALLMSKLNVPTIGWISSYAGVRDRTTYTTLIRLLYPSDSLADPFVSLLEEFGWKTICIFPSDRIDSRNTALAIDRILEGREGYVVYLFRSFTYLATVEDIRALLRIAQTECRILAVTANTFTPEMRKWMTAIYLEDMHHGDYVVVWLLFNYQQDLNNLDGWMNNDETDAPIQAALKSFLLLTFSNPDGYSPQFYQELFNSTLADSPWPGMINLPAEYPDAGSVYLYDGMVLYSRVANYLLNQSQDPTDGELFFQTARNFNFNDTYRGSIFMDDNADRAGYFLLFDVQNSSFTLIAQTNYRNYDVNIRFTFSTEPVWGDGRTGRQSSPTDNPICGFEGEKCSGVQTVTVVIICCVLIVTLLVGLLIIALVRLSPNAEWKVNYDDVILYAASPSKLQSSSKISRYSASVIDRSAEGYKSTYFESLTATYGDGAVYKGVNVVVKTVRKKTIPLTEEQIQELVTLKQCDDINITSFVGACITPPNICVLWEYCSKGSLQEVIGTHFFAKLDHMFKFSIAIDVLRGLQFIHKYLKQHGSLTSRSIVIDSRWVAKITDFGLTLFTRGEEKDPYVTEDQVYRDLYWTAPEILLLKDQSGTMLHYLDLTPDTWPKSRAGDVYSVGIILKELFCLCSPYEEHEDFGLNPKEIIVNLIHDKAFRPKMQKIEMVAGLLGRYYLKTLICECWHSVPEKRPSLAEAYKRIQTINPLPKNSNVIDQMVLNMEVYTKKLEKQVYDATSALQTEKEKCEKLLHTMLPRTVLDSLSRGREVKAEFYESCTLLMSGIPNFVNYTLHHSSSEVITVLNILHSMFDEIVDNYDIYKVNSIADVYVLASGLPHRNGLKHVANIANCALSMMKAVSTAHEKHIESKDFIKVNIGIHTGASMAGVIGLTVPQYDVYGDTINTTSRMMKYGKAMRIHMSFPAYEALSIFPGYIVADRGSVSIKGKGYMHTYWLFGKDNFVLHGFPDELFDDDENAFALPVTTGNPAVAKGVNEPKLLKESNSFENCCTI